VGLLIVVVIIGGVVAWYFLWGPGRSRPASPPPVSTPGALREQAKSVECVTQLQQIRQALQMAQTTDGRYPASLTQLQAYGVTPSILYCPASQRPYQYDPSSGRVWCPTHPNQ
jgi:hypothetical protein